MEAARANAGTGPAISPSASPLAPAFSFEKDGLSRTPRGSSLTIGGRKDAMPRLSESVSGALRTFSFWIANRSVGHPLLDGIDYSCIFEEPSALEQVYAIYANVLEFDESGQVINARHAERRAAQYILSYVTGRRPEPEFEGWEVALHAPPPKIDAKSKSA